ncbi:MAG TPA: hypothetical protein V6C57_16780 [Coleofasciculaceae cyanobacterium]
MGVARFSIYYNWGDPEYRRIFSSENWNTILEKYQSLIAEESGNAEESDNTEESDEYPTLYAIASNITNDVFY